MIFGHFPWISPYSKSYNAIAHLNSDWLGRSDGINTSILDRYCISKDTILKL